MISLEKSAFIRSLADADGYIEPRDVVKAARARTSPLHDEFDWNVTSAAQAHWIETARKLIRFVKLEVIILDQKIRSVAYVTDPARPSDSRRFIDLTIAAQNRDISQQVLLDELGRISSAILRAQQVATVLGLRQQLDEMLADVSRLVQMAEAMAEQRRQAAQERAKAKRGRAKATKGKRSRGRRTPPPRGNDEARA